MRILYFSRSYSTHDHNFLSKIVSFGAEVYFLQLENEDTHFEGRPLPDRVTQIRWGGIAPELNTPENLMGLMPEFVDIIEKTGPDLIHAGPAQSCGFMMALSGFHPYVFMSWGYDILFDMDKNDYSKWVTRFAVTRADALVCDCDAVRNKVSEMRPFPEDKIAQFPWGVDFLHFAPGGSSLKLREKAGWRDAFIVITTRYWSQLYGTYIVLESFRNAHEKREELRLVMVGHGPQADYVNRFIDNNGLGDCVLLPGPVTRDDMRDYFREADLYLSCSKTDGASVSLLEAMATGLPVVVTDGPGNAEWVSQGANGWLAEGVDDFSDAIITASGSDSAALETMSRANRKQIENRADWDQNTGRLLALYKSLLNDC